MQEESRNTAFRLAKGFRGSRTIAVRALGVVLFCASCKSAADAYKQDVQYMCDGPSLGAKRFNVSTMDEYPAGWPGKSIHIARVVNETLRTSKGHDLWGGIASPDVGPKEKASKLAAEASRLGIAPCQQVDFFLSAPPAKRE